MGLRGGIAIFDGNTGERSFSDSDYGDSSFYIAFTDDESLLASSSADGSIRLYRKAGSGYALVRKLAAKSGKEPFGLSFARSGTAFLLAVGFVDCTSVDVYSASSADIAYSFSPDTSGIDKGNLALVAFCQAPGFLRLVAGGGYSPSTTPLFAWEDAGRGSRRSIEIGARNSIMDIQAQRDGSMIVGASDPFIARLDQGLSPVFSLKGALADFRDAGGAFSFAEGDTAIAFPFEEWGADASEFSLASRDFRTPGPSSPPDTTSLKIENWRQNPSPTLNGSPLSLAKFEESRCYCIAPDKRSFLLGADWYLRCFSSEGKELWSAAAPCTTWAVAVSPDGMLGAAAYADGTIHWYRMDTGKELLAFFPHSDKKHWVAWTPSGYYDASPGAEDLIGWHLNRGLDKAPDYYPASRFRSAYYRPDVVALVLSAMDEKAALARADEAAGRRAQAGGILGKLPPTVAIVDPASGSSFSGNSVRITYRVSAPDDAPVTGVRALVDGRPTETAKGLSVAAKSGSDLAIEVPVPDRSCAVSLIAENRNGASEAVTIQLAKAAATADEFTIKPKLYVLAVGVSAYDNPDYRLAYAAKDARDLAAAFQRQKGGLFRDAELKILTDKDASKDNILDGLDWIQRQTTAKDVAVMYFSGHGFNDATQNYYYLPVGADLDRLKRSGVPFSDITSTVSAIAGKVLFFIDTCHSGNLMKGRKAVGVERDIAATINELASAENGAVVFASSSGSQYSYEDPAWGNGAFTKALIEGLSGKAAYGSGPKITVNMLDLYLSERVKALTGGRQTPTTTKPANVPDFPVAVKGP
jgi:WD40 repeat protein